MSEQPTTTQTPESAANADPRARASPQLLAILASVDACKAQLHACVAALDSITAACGAMMHTHAVTLNALRPRDASTSKRGLPDVFGAPPEGFDAPVTSHFGESNAEQRRGSDPIERLDGRT